MASGHVQEMISLPELQDEFSRGPMDKWWKQPLFLPNHHPTVARMHLHFHYFYVYSAQELTGVAARK